MAAQDVVDEATLQRALDPVEASVSRSRTSRRLRRRCRPSASARSRPTVVLRPLKAVARSAVIASGLPSASRSTTVVSYAVRQGHSSMIRGASECVTSTPRWGRGRRRLDTTTWIGSIGDPGRPLALGIGSSRWITAADGPQSAASGPQTSKAAPARVSQSTSPERITMIPRCSRCHFPDVTAQLDGPRGHAEAAFIHGCGGLGGRDQAQLARVGGPLHAVRMPTRRHTGCAQSTGSPAPAPVRADGETKATLWRTFRFTVNHGIP